MQSAISGTLSARAARSAGRASANERSIARERTEASTTTYDPKPESFAQASTHTM